MGMDGGTLALILSQLGSSAISAWGMPDMPEGQELQSFAGHPRLDPQNMYDEARAQTQEAYGLIKARANRPVSVRSGYVQQPPVFTGGGLPMPIGVSGMDPALADKSLLSLGGMAGEEQFPPRDGRPPDVIPDPDHPDSPPPDTTPGDESGPYGTLSSATAGPARRTAPTALPGQSLFAAPNVSEHDDLGQGTGAMELYLRSMAGL